MCQDIEGEANPYKHTPPYKFAHSRGKIRNQIFLISCFNLQEILTNHL